MKNVVVIGRINTMSNKNDSKFKQEVPTKTAYITVDKENAVKLIDFGLTQYTSQDDNEEFFIVKCSQNLSCYTSNTGDEPPAKIDMSVASGESIKTADGIDIKLNIICGENMGNVFYRLQAIKINSTADIEEIKATNPFSE